MSKTSVKNFGDQAKKVTSSQARHHETEKENKKFKILQNVTLMKVSGQDDEDQNTMRKSNTKLNKRNRREEDEAEISDTQSFLNYCNSYILKKRNSSSDSSLAVSDDNKDNEQTIALPNGRKNKASRIGQVNKNRNSFSDSSPIITDNNNGKNKIASLPGNGRKQDDHVGQAKKKRKLCVKNEEGKKMKKRNNSIDSSLDNSDNNKGSEMSRFPEEDQMRKRQKLIEKNGTHKGLRRRDCSFSSSTIVDVMPNQFESDEKRQNVIKRRRLNENSGNYSSLNSSSVNNDKENETSKILGGNRKKSNCVDQVKRKEKSKGHKRENSSYSSSVNNDGDEDNEIGSATNKNHQETKKKIRMKLVYDNSSGGVGAVSTNKKTKLPLNDINRTRQTRVSFSSESSIENDSHVELKNGEKVIRVINKHKISNKFSDESSVFSSSSAANEFSNICVDFQVMDESARQQRVTEFLTKWCPSDEDIDIISHLERAKSKSIGVGGTLENIVLNSSKLYGQEARELEVDLSIYHQRKSLLNKGKAKSLPSVAAICGVSVNSRLKENNKSKRNASECINRRVCENKEESTEMLQGRKLRQLNTPCDDISKSQKSLQKGNDSEISKANGQRDKKSENVNRPQEFQQKDNDLEADGESEEEWQGRKKQVRLRNKYLGKSKAQKFQQENSDSKTSKANGEAAEKSPGIKRRLRQRNNCYNYSETRTKNGGSEEELQGIKKRPRKCNKTSDKSKQRKLYSLESWVSSPEFLALGEENN